LLAHDGLALSIRTQGISTQSAKTIADTARNFGQTDDITVLSFDFKLPGTLCALRGGNQLMQEGKEDTSPQREICLSI